MKARRCLQIFNDELLKQVLIQAECFEYSGVWSWVTIEDGEKVFLI